MTFVMLGAGQMPAALCTSEEKLRTKPGFAIANDVSEI